mgnify:CR=1 FL=1|jgi:hypothetical protein
MSGTVMLGLHMLQCAHLCSPALWLPPYDLGLGGDFRTSEAAVSEGELISKIRARLYLRLGLLFTRGAKDSHGTQTRNAEVFPQKPND